MTIVKYIYQRRCLRTFAARCRRFAKWKAKLVQSLLKRWDDEERKNLTTDAEHRKKVFSSSAKVQIWDLFRGRTINHAHKKMVFDELYKEHVQAYFRRLKAFNRGEGCGAPPSPGKGILRLWTAARKVNHMKRAGGLVGAEGGEMFAKAEAYTEEFGFGSMVLEGPLEDEPRRPPRFEIDRESFFLVHPTSKSRWNAILDRRPSACSVTPGWKKTKRDIAAADDYVSKVLNHLSKEEEYEAHQPMVLAASAELKKQEREGSGSLPQIQSNPTHPRRRPSNSYSSSSSFAQQPRNHHTHTEQPRASTSLGHNTPHYSQQGSKRRSSTSLGFAHGEKPTAARHGPHTNRRNSNTPNYALSSLSNASKLPSVNLGTGRRGSNGNSFNMSMNSTTTRRGSGSNYDLNSSMVSTTSTVATKGGGRRKSLGLSTTSKDHIPVAQNITTAIPNHPVHHHGHHPKKNHGSGPLNKLANQLGQSVVDQIKTLYNRYDNDNNGSLSLFELANLLEDMCFVLGVNCPPEEGIRKSLRETWQKLDTDRNGVISMDEFVVLLQNSTIMNGLFRKYGVKRQRPVLSSVVPALVRRGE
eukprot:TRINITY_DN63927_c0_g1_i1.p1 TRINITY_DN63927_c0_g1~~TRINITY_DN63927_c0_g1_i1.p1  ORF type:complete len:656 (+),score=28.53 TRINITY_DN63927_c0_g1_i1:221-1969(+)